MLLMQQPGGRCVEPLFILALMGPAISRRERYIFACFPHAYGAWHVWTDCVVIRIRYKDFSAGTHDLAGLHGKAEGCARAATVYLLPGLAAWQRRAVIRRLRQEASRGFGPPLPQPQLAVALGVDRVRAAARIVTAIVRLHPAVTLLPGVFVVAMMTLFVIASGERPGIMSGARGGLADTAAVSGSTVRIASAERTRAWMARVTAAEGSGGVDAGGTEVGSGRRALIEQAHGERSAGSPPVAVPARQGAWYFCPPVVAAPSWPPRDGQLACHRPAPRAVPHTAHLPGPLDFAW